MLDLPENTAILNLVDYRRMVEDTMLNRMKAEKLERRNRELIEECDSLRQRLAVLESGR